MTHRADALTLHASFFVDPGMARRVRDWIRDALLAFGTHAASEIAAFADSVGLLVSSLRIDAHSLALDLVVAVDAIEAHVLAVAGGAETRTVLYRRA